MRYPVRVVEHYRELLRSGEPFVEREPAESAPRALLEELAAAGYLAATDRRICPSCRHTVAPQDESERRCSHCQFSFEREEPAIERVYARPGRRSRDVRWVVTVHGMNTRGPWQEEFSWKLARIYGYAVPVAIYKYGKLLISPFLLLAQERYALLLMHQLQNLREEMKAEGYGDRPDVVAHSFGTWLLGRVLELDPALRLGRVVLTGSVIPPDFPWAKYFAGADPRVEAVLCHYSDRDGVVPFAEYLVPRGGPSGRRGFNREEAPAPLVHRLAKGFAHSDYFAPQHLEQVMNEVWGEFLTLPAQELASWGERLPSPPPRRWRRSRLGLLTHALKLVMLGLLAALALAAVAALAVGARLLLGLAP